MKNKKLIITQIESYEKTYRETKDFEQFRTNMYSTILDIENITPVSPFYSSYLFRIKLDFENVDRMNASDLVLSLKTFLEGLETN